MSGPRPLALFFASALLITGLLHGAIIVLGLEFSLSLGRPAIYLYLLGIAVPALVAIALQPAGERLGFLRASVSTPVRSTTFAAALLAQPIIVLMAWAMAAMAGPVEALRVSLAPGFALIAAGQIWVALGEELGWRGFALPRLLELADARRATLILAAIWGTWHAPMFFVAGSLQAQGSPWLFAASIFAWSTIHTALYVRERPSLVVNLAFHACANIALNLGITNERLTPHLIVAYVLSGAVMLLLLRRRTS